MPNTRTLAVAAATFLASTLPLGAHAHDRDYAHVHREKSPDGEAEATVYASVEVEASALGSSGSIVRSRINERAGLAMHEAGILPARNREDATLRVKIDPAPDEQPGYVVEVWIERAGATEGERKQVDCSLCTETELVDSAVGGIEHALAAIEPESPEPAAEDSPSVEPPPPEPTPPVEPPRDDAKRPLGPKGKAGIGLLVGGTVLAATGIGLVIPEPEPLSDDPTSQRSFRPPGSVLLGVGAAALVTGAVLLGVDRSRSRRTTMAPAVGPRSAGIVIRGRF